MQRSIIVAMLSLLFFALPASSQNQPAKKAKAHVKVPIIAAKSEDVSTIESLITASYETISGDVGVPRQWGRERTLNDPHARFVSAEVDSKTGATKIWQTTDQEFADQSDAMMVKEGFTERELGHVIHRYGNVASVLSSYEGKSARTGKADRGVNIFELYNDGKRWWILSIVWDSERAGNPIPPELLGAN